MKMNIVCICTWHRKEQYYNMTMACSQISKRKEAPEYSVKKQTIKVGLIIGGALRYVNKYIHPLLVCIVL
jgi:hypothetical protein